MKTLRERYRNALDDISSAKVLYEENVMFDPPSPTHRGYVNYGSTDNDWAGNFANDGKYFALDQYDIPCYCDIGEYGRLEFVEYTNKLKVYVSSYTVGELITCVFSKYNIVAKHNDEYGNVTIIFDV